MTKNQTVHADFLEKNIYPYEYKFCSKMYVHTFFKDLYSIFLETTPEDSLNNNTNVIFFQDENFHFALRSTHTLNR